MSVISLRYAHALASVVEAQHLDTAAMRQQLNDFAEILAESHELREVLADPSIANPQKLRVLDAIAGKMGLIPQVRNFIAVVTDHGRLAAFEEMVREFALASEEEAGISEVQIMSAHPLNDEGRAELEAQVAKLAGSRVHATYSEDPTLLGGAVVRIGSTVYDGSLKAQLAQLKQRLVNA